MARPTINNTKIYNAGIQLISTNTPSFSITPALDFVGYINSDDPLGHGRGIWVYGQTGLGTWQYSTDNGSTWYQMYTPTVNPPLSTSSALQLPEFPTGGGASSRTLLRYVATSSVETATLSFVGANYLAWANVTPGANVGRANISSAEPVNTQFYSAVPIPNVQNITLTIASSLPPGPDVCVIPTSTYTVRDLLTSSLRKLGIVQSGEPMPDDDIMDTMECANDVLSSWVLERLMCFHIVNESFSLTPGKNTYTIGKCADLNITTRPIRIERAFLDILTSTPVLTLPVEIINFEQYAEITVKNTSNSIPTKLYYEPTYVNGFPWGTIHLWGVPSVSNRLQLWYWSQIAEFTDIDQIIDLPPQYKKALRYAIAVEIASEYGVTPSPLVVQIAESSIAKIKRVNQVISVIGVDDAVSGVRRTFNYLTGE